MNGSSAYVGKILVTACMGRVRGLEPTTGRLLWEAQLQPGTSLTANIQKPIELVVREDVVLAAPYGTGELWCIDYRTGSVIGQVEVGLGRKTIVVEDDLIFVGVGGDVRCYTVRGELLWEDRPEGVTGDMALGFPGNVRHGDER